MRRSLAVISVAAAAVLVGAVACGPPGRRAGPAIGPSAGSASSGLGGPRDAGSSGGGGLATFRILCASSHIAPDDPIVHPNMAGMSHLHQFLGNRTTNATSTAQSLRGQATTCSAPTDSSAYWVPMLYQNGAAVPAQSALIYYRGGSHRNPGAVQAFPAGLRVIAGSATATGPLPTDAVAWMCQGMNNPSPTPPNCGGGTLVLQIRFPDCWDGRNLDAPDHRSHMAYTVSGGCPSNYPVPVPLLEFNLRYKTFGNTGLTLASGAPYTYHADFFNAWNQTAQANFIGSCIHAMRECGTVS
jgi:Domain of unknown function (DUF1996)